MHSTMTRCLVIIFHPDYCLGNTLQVNLYTMWPRLGSIILVDPHTQPYSKPDPM